MNEAFHLVRQMWSRPLVILRVHLQLHENGLNDKLLLDQEASTRRVNTDFSQTEEKVSRVCGSIHITQARGCRCETREVKTKAAVASRYPGQSFIVEISASADASSNKSM